MTTIAILPEQGDGQPTTYSAVAAERIGTGRTAGEALDALTSQLSAEEAGGPVIIQHFQPDRFFPAAKRERLSSLMARWRAARDAGGALPPSEQAELEELVDEELEAAAERAADIPRGFEVFREFYRYTDKSVAESDSLSKLYEVERQLRRSRILGLILTLTAAAVLILAALTTSSGFTAGVLATLSMYAVYVAVLLVLSIHYSSAITKLVRRRDGPGEPRESAPERDHVRERQKAR